MFSKLALRNVRRSFRDYGVYLLTLTFGVCLFYTFNSIDGQGAMVYLAQNQNPMVEPILMLIDIFSIFVAVVLACLILYANRFLLRRRKRELGTYLLLGLSQGQVSRLLFLETGVVGLLSLAAGLGLGVAASYGMSALTLSMFEMDVSDLLAITFSPGAAVKTVLYFGLIFLLVMLFSGVQVSRAKLIDLMQGERKNEVLKPRPLGVAVFQFLLGVVFLAAAYAILLTFGMAIAVAVLPICVPMLTLGTLGTLLIFRSLSGFVLKFVQGRPRLYYKNLNLFTLRQWISKVHSTYLAQTVVCILLLLAIGITASSVGLNSTIESMTGYQSPFDITVQNRNADALGPMDFDALLEEHGVNSSALSWQQDTIFYYNDASVTGIEEASAAVRLSDYNALLARQGKPGYSGPLPHLQEGSDVTLTTGNLGLSYLIIPDEMASELKIRRQVWSADYAGNGGGGHGRLAPVPGGKLVLVHQQSADHLSRGHGQQDPGPVPGAVPGLYLPAGSGGCAGPPAAESGGGQYRPVCHPPPAGGRGTAGGPISYPAGGPGLPAPPRAGPDPFRRWNESSQRAHLHRREGGQRRQQRRHRPGPASCVRGLLLGYRSGMPTDG